MNYEFCLIVDMQSVARNRLHDLKPFPSGKSAYRFLVDQEKTLNNPKLGDIVQRDGEFSIWYGADRFFFLVCLAVPSFLCI